MDYRKDFKSLLDQTLRQLKRGVNKTVLKVPEIEQTVLDATCNEPWGPHGSAMAEIARASRNHDEYVTIMTCLWKRLASKGKNWLHVYKALTVLEYLIANGSERILIDVWEHMDEIQALSTDFEYIEPPPPCEKDQGVNVRKKAELLVTLLNDKNKVADVRLKAAANRHKYYGIASSNLSSCSSQETEGSIRHMYDGINPSSNLNKNITGEKREPGVCMRRGSAPPTYDETFDTYESKLHSRRESAPSSFQNAIKLLSKKKAEIMKQSPLQQTSLHRDQHGRCTSLPTNVVTMMDGSQRDKYGRSASVPAIHLKKKDTHLPYFDDDDNFDPRK